MKARFIKFFDGLNERERRALIIGGVGLVLYLAYIIYRPLHESVLENETLLSQKIATKNWMKGAEARYVFQEKGVAALDSARVLRVFSDALSHASFHTFPYQLQQLEDGALQLSFESVPYSAFLKWLWSMGQKYKMEVKAFSAEKTEVSGLVRVQLILTLHT